MAWFFVLFFIFKNFTIIHIIATKNFKLLSLFKDLETDSTMVLILL